MKQHLRFILSGACWLALLGVSALAQEQGQQEAKKKVAIEKAVADEVEVQFKGELFKVMLSKFGFETKFVKGAPYAATAEAETVQRLADGNRIRSKTATSVYRDGEGRTRRESVGKDPSVVTEVFISDPTSGVNYSLDPQRRAAVKSQGADLMALDLAKMKVVREQKLQTRARGPVAESAEKPMKKRRPVTESLGKQVIEGVECEGTRSTITIPAGQVGNDLPLEIVSEEWHSPALQVLVLTRHNDPRNGETTYRLTNINRSEPDRALFEVPADYTVRDEFSGKPKAVKKPEEEQR